MSTLQERQALDLFKKYSYKDLTLLQAFDSNDEPALKKAITLAKEHEEHLRDNRPQIDVLKRKRIYMRGQK